MSQIRKRRKFEPGFKRQLLAQIDAGELTLSAAARLHELSPTVIQYWRKQSQTGGHSDGPRPEEKRLAKELEHYKRLLAEAHREIDNLKKAEEWIRLRKKQSTSIVTGPSLVPSKQDADK